MRGELAEHWRAVARKTVGAWKADGREFASIVDGVPTPWDSAPIKVIMAEAQRRHLDVLCLAEPSHVEAIVTAICACFDSATDVPALSPDLGLN
jgi:hypothetical protein